MKIIKTASSLKGEAVILGDKSIAHRAVILGALASGKTVIKNFPPNDDCLATINVLKKLGVKIISRAKEVIVFGVGLRGFKKPAKPIFVNNSGTTLRIILGVLAGQNFKVCLIAAQGLTRRPMARVTEPLRKMGAVISSRYALYRGQAEEFPPITIHGGKPKAICYKIPMASAQVKSAILLAGLYASGRTMVIEKFLTRDHTERMLRAFGAKVKSNGKKITIAGSSGLVSPGRLYVPGDISSAAFFLVLGAIHPNAKIVLKNISLNPTRGGIPKALKRMGANLQIINKKFQRVDSEPVGDIIIQSSRLKSLIVKKEEVPVLIDELPVLMVAACFARGTSVFEGVEELRVKETDRINSMLANLRKMGADIRVVKAGASENIIIHGSGALFGAKVKSFGDHRTAMSMVVAGLAARGRTEIDDINCINKSFPGFMAVIKKLS